MEVSYRNSFWDHVQFNLYIIFHSALSFIILVPGLFIWGDLILDVWREADSAPSLLRAIVLGIFFVGGLGVFFLLVMFVVLFSVFLMYIGRNAKWDEAKIQVLENGLVTKASVGQSEIQWSGIKAIKQNKRLIFIFISKYMACIVPKRAFPNEADANRFFTYINDLWQKSRDENNPSITGSQV